MISIFDLVIGIIFIYLLYRYYIIRKLYKDETESNLSGCEVGNKILDNKNAIIKSSQHMIAHYKKANPTILFDLKRFNPGFEKL